VLREVSIIDLDTLKRVQIGPERLAEDLDVVHPPRHVWAAEPADVSALDSHGDFVADSRLLELVRVPGRASLRDPAIGPIHRQQAIIACVSLVPVFKLNLKRIVRM
jgi:hypothetical protein